MLKMNNRGSGVFDIGVDVILSPLKFLAVGAFLILFFIIYASPSDANLDTDLVESQEVVNHVLRCVLKNNVVDESLITYSYLSSCAPSEKYGIEVRYDELHVTLNEHIYSTFKGLCKREAHCNSFFFLDSFSKEFSVEVVFKYNE